jgi:exonuclease SbcC
MNVLTLNWAKIVNFKALRHLELSFAPETWIIGRNGAGKTSIHDAIEYLLWGKNSEGDAQFSIKRRNKDGSYEEKNDVDISAGLSFNGTPIVLRRVYKEVWSKKTGELNARLTGHTTQYWCNEEPVKEAEYKAKVNALIDEKIFKLITDVYAFNKLDWKERRGHLLKIGGEISNEEMVALRPQYAPLVEAMKTLNFEGFKKKLKSRETELKDALQGIPNRVDEVRRGLSRLSETDFNALQAQAEEKEKELQQIEEKLMGGTDKQKEQAKKVKQGQGLLNLISGRRFSIQQSVGRHNDEYNREKFRRDSEIANLTQSLKDGEEVLKKQTENIVNIDKELEDLRGSYAVVKAREFEYKEDGLCPHCGQELPAEMKENARAKLLLKFNEEKSNALKTINSTGTQKKAVRLPPKVL